MKEIIIFTVVSGLSFLFFILILVTGLIKKNRIVISTSGLLLLMFLAFASFTGYQLIGKSYNKVSGTLRARTGEEIYEAVLGKQETNCIKIINYEEQVFRKVNYVTWLHFEACPAELKRILSRHEYMNDKLPADSLGEDVPYAYADQLSWFNPKSIGDTIVVFEFAADDSRSIQTLWISPDSTNVFCRDILNERRPNRHIYANNR